MSQCVCVPGRLQSQALMTPLAWLPTHPRGRDNLLQFSVVIQQQLLVISPFDFFLPLLI